MTISKDLFLSILSMDAYNRGYNPGIDGLSDETNTKIGNATIKDRSSSVAGSSEVDASFYASSYKLDAAVDSIASGTTIISYRGTDEFASEVLPVDLPISFLASRRVGETHVFL